MIKAKPKPIGTMTLLTVSLFLAGWMLCSHKTEIFDSCIYLSASAAEPSAKINKSDQEIQIREEGPEELEVGELYGEKRHPGLSALLRARDRFLPNDSNRLPLTSPLSEEPLTFDSDLRRPFIFFREATNRSWPPILLFLIMLFMGSTLRFAAPGLTGSCINCCRKNFLVTAASGFFYTSILMILARSAFRVETLTPLGILCIGMLQLSYIIGLALSVDFLAAKLAARLPKHPVTAFLCILIVALALTLVSFIPALGKLPRLGNRILLTLAMIGIGSLVRHFKKPVDTTNQTAISTTISDP